VKKFLMSTIWEGIKVVRDRSDGGNSGFKGGQSGIMASSLLGADLCFFGAIVLEQSVRVSLYLTILVD